MALGRCSFQIAIPSLPSPLPTPQTLLWDQNKTARAALAVSCPPCGQSQQGVSLNPVRHRAAVCVIECPKECFIDSGSFRRNPAGMSPVNLFDGKDFVWLN
ncbi:hypothetical protein CEXT_790101 [Caerostris extrusa]|uniref:Uncharacterized protein n=1 Tax=Caerostris extrusa TaxID=172846 RepID=A0AAV4TIR3_CAEEX|nr:hypothetical protein CEXT_790101 [Caerostris extrusa]